MSTFILIISKTTHQSWGSSQEDWQSIGIALHIVWLTQTQVHRVNLGTNNNIWSFQPAKTSVFCCTECTDGSTMCTSIPEHHVLPAPTSTAGFDFESFLYGTLWKRTCAVMFHVSEKISCVFSHLTPTPCSGCFGFIWSHIELHSRQDYALIFHPHVEVKMKTFEHLCLQDL